MHKIIKRDGRIVNFKKEKIAAAIRKSILAANGEDGRLADEVAALIGERTSNIPTVEDVQNIVEEVLVKHGMYGVAKAYTLYKGKRSEIRDAKRFFGVYDELKLTVNAIEVLNRRYLMKNEAGNDTCLAAQTRPHHPETIESLLRPCRQHRHDPLVN